MANPIIAGVKYTNIFKGLAELCFEINDLGVDEYVTIKTKNNDFIVRRTQERIELVKFVNGDEHCHSVPFSPDGDVYTTYDRNNLANFIAHVAKRIF